MDPVRMLREMVAIESLSGAEGELAGFLVSVMTGLGFDAHVDGAGNAVGIRRGPEAPEVEERELVLLGHMDTVPGRIPVRIEGGLLFGRGSVDAKGPLAAFVQAVAGVDPAPGVRLVVIGAVEEEAATSRGARFVATRPRPEACVIGEPSGWDALTLGYKGRLLVDYRLEQPCGHSAGPERAVAERAVGFWCAVTELCEGFNADRELLFDRLAPSLRSIRTTSDGLADVVDATLGFRLPPGFDVAGLQTGLRELAGEAALVCYGAEPAWTTPRTTPLARAFLRAIRRQGGEPRFKHKTGTSDMNVLGPAWRCPIAAYGPGDSRLDHAPDEHLSLPEYLRSIDVLRDVLIESGYARGTRSARRS